MTQVTCEVLWLGEFLKELGLTCTTPMDIYSYNQAAIFIANNHVFHESIKNIEVDCHEEAITNKLICTPYTKSENQFADIFSKSMG